MFCMGLYWFFVFSVWKGAIHDNTTDLVSRTFLKSCFRISYPNTTSTKIYSYNSSPSRPYSMLCRGLCLKRRPIQVKRMTPDLSPFKKENTKRKKFAPFLPSWPSAVGIPTIVVHSLCITHPMRFSMRFPCVFHAYPMHIHNP